MSIIIRLFFAFVLLTAVRSGAQTQYELGPDSKPQDGVPRGKVTEHRWIDSKVFPGTERDYWVYVPAQYDGSQPACVMVFQDGGGFVKPDGAYRAPVVLDNVIHQKQVPITIGIFINPGILPASGENRLP